MFLADRAHHRQHAPQLLFFADGRRIRPGAFATDVEYVGPFGEQFFRAADGTRWIEKLAAAANLSADDFRGRFEPL